MWATDLLNAMHHLDAAGGGVMAPVKRESARLVRRYWSAIERVATALIERGELTGDEVDWRTLHRLPLLPHTASKSRLATVT